MPNNYPYFPDEEFKRIGSDPEMMDPDFMDKLISLREDLGFPLPLNSAWRSEERNKVVGGSKMSAHLDGKAVDIAASGVRALQIIEQARNFGFTGIGINQKGSHQKRFIHLDTAPQGDDLRPRPALWSYA